MPCVLYRAIHADAIVLPSLMKEPLKRGTYAQLLEHPFLVEDRTREVDMVGWVESAITARNEARKAARAAAAGVTSPGASSISSTSTHTPALSPGSSVSTDTTSTESDETVQS